jgi:WS/DGAT/MGAT family acyltransferase
MLVVRLHHAMVDGLSTMRVIEVMHDLERHAPKPEPPAEAWTPQPGPGALTRLVEAVGDQVRLTARTTLETVSLLDPRRFSRHVRTLGKMAASLGPTAMLPPPPTPFNAPISDRRDLAWLELPLDDVRAIKQALGGTVNHVVLGVLSGGLRRYLQRHGRDPDRKPLRVEVPVGMRPPEKRDALGNLVSIVIAALPVDVEDPLERYNKGRREMERVMQMGQAEGLHTLVEWSNRLPAALHHATWRWSPSRWPYPVNLVSTNVPGPKETLYLNGHEVVGFYPTAPLWTTLGAILCTISYTDTVTLALVVDPELIPDVWETIEDFRAAYDELYARAVRESPGVLATSTPIES